MTLKPSLPDQLTGREIEILKRLAGGLSNQEIASELFLSLNTVKWYNRKIFEKLGASSRTQAIARGRELLAALEARSPGPEGLPALETPGARLPAEITRFVGRVRECAEIERLLHRNRLVTLTGPPGTGKTRLALHVARRAAESRAVCFIPLVAVASPERILWAMAERLDFQFQAAGDLLKQMLAFLGEKQALLVLDNFEHLVAGAALLTDILAAAPGVKFLVTSRERLNLYGEASYTLSGLALPGEQADRSEADRSEADRSEAVELFLEQAQSVSPDLEIRPGDLEHITRICHLVDGMPLGIELAATWMDTLRPQEIVAEIEHNLDILAAERQDVPPSQRSIRAAFERSWNLLEEQHRAAFRRLAVFRGGFTREAGEAVAGVGLRDLHALVNKSLIRRSPQTGRYDVHELLRFYAGEQLARAGEAESIRYTHAAYFADFMAERWHWMKDYRQKTALDEIEADIVNARAAWQYWVQAGEVAQIKKFLHSLWAIYDVRGWYPAGIELFEGAVTVMRAAAGPEAEACLGWLLAAQGLFSIPVTDYDPARPPGPSQILADHGLYFEMEAGPRQGLALAQNGIEILRRAGGPDEMMVIPLISVFITASLIPGEEALASQAAEECLEIATRLGDQWAIAKARQFLAVRAIESSDYTKAWHLAQEALHAFEASGNHWSSSVVCIEVLGLLAITQRQFDTAREWIERGLKAAKEIDFKYSIQTAYWQLGFVAALEEKFAQAGSYWQKALEVSEHMLGGRSFIGLGSAIRTRQT